LTSNIQCTPSKLFPETVTGTVSVEVKLPVATIARAFDGQHWDDCSDSPAALHQHRSYADL
jgi:hypothetical protein